MIIYGSAWNPGLYQVWGNSISAGKTILIAIAMITLMTLMVYLLNKFRIKNKQLVT
jgi:hypothetical protein